MNPTITNTSDPGGRPFSPEQVRSVAPALERHTQERLFGEVWSRPDLDRRDRSLTLDIMKIMLWRISVPVLLANAIAWPVSYSYLERWLQGFADHIWLDPTYFVVGGAIALLITWATVFVHTLPLARMSPVHALRSE